MPTQFFAVLFEMAQLLNTQLDKETLATCVGMIESGANPEALAVSDLFFRRATLTTFKNRQLSRSFDARA